MAVSKVANLVEEGTRKDQALANQRGVIDALQRDIEATREDNARLTERCRKLEAVRDIVTRWINSDPHVNVSHMSAALAACPPPEPAANETCGGVAMYSAMSVTLRSPAEPAAVDLAHGEAYLASEVEHGDDACQPEGGSDASA
jgi:hypothetical protein